MEEFVGEKKWNFLEEKGSERNGFRSL